MEKLRGLSIKLDFENDLSALVRSEGIKVAIVNGVVNVIE